MSHRCGANCRRRQQPSQRKNCPSCGSRRLPRTITAGGRTRSVTRHARTETHPGITAKRIERALEDWVVRGVCKDKDGILALVHWGFVPGLRRMIKVVVSLDDERIITAYQDRNATNNWKRGDRAYFLERCRSLEERNAGDLR